MKAKDIFNIKNISSFIEGHARLFYDKLVGLPQHEREQIAWRLTLCKDDCLVTGKCKVCTCPPEKKMFVRESCNNGERFPDIMGKEEWEQYKIDNNINIDG